MYLKIDMFFENFKILEKIEIKENKIYCVTDNIFYGKSNFFINVFLNFFNKILKEYYGNLEYIYHNINNKIINSNNFVDSIFEYANNKIRLTNNEKLNRKYGHEIVFLYHILQYGIICSMDFKAIRQSLKEKLVIRFHNKKGDSIKIEYKKNKYLKYCENLVIDSN